MDELKQIKYNRSPEAFLIGIIDGMTIKNQDRFINSFLYEYNNNVLFEYSFNTKCLYVSYDLIRLVLENKYGMESGVMSQFIMDLWNNYAVDKGYKKVDFCSWSECTYK